MTNRNWVKFLKAALASALKAMAKTAVATIGSMDLISAIKEWRVVVCAAVLSAILSLVTNLIEWWWVDPEINKSDEK